MTSDFLLEIGENIQVGNKVITVIDIEGDEIIFRVESLNKSLGKQLSPESKMGLPRNPR